MKAWLEFVSSGSLKRAYGQNYDRDLEALRKDGASLLEANLELAARYRDKGGKLSAGAASPAQAIESRGEFQGLLETQQSSVGSSERDAQRRKGMSQELWKASSDSWERAQTALGSALNPYLDNLAKGARYSASRLRSCSKPIRGRRPVLPPPQVRCYPGISPTREGAALSTCCVAVGSVGEDRCRR